MIVETQIFILVIAQFILLAIINTFIWFVFGIRGWRICIRKEVVDGFLTKYNIEVLSVDVKHVQITLFNLFLNFERLFLELLLVHILDLIAFNFLLKARPFKRAFSESLNEFVKLFFNAY